MDYSAKAMELNAILKSSHRVSIVSHINPDPDTICTMLGVYSWLKERNISAEMVNASKYTLPGLYRMPNIGKIKKKMDFDDSLIVSCDCGSVDRLGVDISDRDVINIDHHKTNNNFGILNIVDAKAVSSSEVAYRLLKNLGDISKESAIAFYAALISDTRNFTTANVSKDTLDIAKQMANLGADIGKIAQDMLTHRSLASLRVLGVAINSLELKCNAKLAVLMVNQEDMLNTGAQMSDLDGIVDYGKSLATVELAFMLVENENHIKVSIRSKKVDISKLCVDFGGGGHEMAGGFEVSDITMDTLSNQLIRYTNDKGLLS